MADALALAVALPPESVPVSSVVVGWMSVTVDCAEVTVAAEALPVSEADPEADPEAVSEEEEATEVKLLMGPPGVADVRAAADDVSTTDVTVARSESVSSGSDTASLSSSGAEAAPVVARAASGRRRAGSVGSIFFCLVFRRVFCPVGGDRSGRGGGEEEEEEEGRRDAFGIEVTPVVRSVVPELLVLLDQ